MSAKINPLKVMHVACSNITIITDIYDQVSLENFKNYDDFFREAKAMGIVKGKSINIKIAEINTHMEYQRFMAGYNIRVD